MCSHGWYLDVLNLNICDFSSPEAGKMDLWHSTEAQRCYFFNNYFGEEL